MVWSGDAFVAEARDEGVASPAISACNQAPSWETKWFPFISRGKGVQLHDWLSLRVRSAPRFVTSYPKASGSAWTRSVRAQRVPPAFLHDLTHFLQGAGRRRVTGHVFPGGAAAIDAI